MNQQHAEAAERAFSQGEAKLFILIKWQIIATGAIAAVLVNALAGSGDHPHLSAMFISWLIALPFMMLGIFQAGMIYFRQYKLFYYAERDNRPKWLRRLADCLIEKTPKKIKTALHWTAETYLLLFSVLVAALAFSVGSLCFFRIGKLQCNRIGSI